MGVAKVEIPTGKRPWIGGRDNMARGEGEKGLVEKKRKPSTLPTATKWQAGPTTRNPTGPLTSIPCIARVKARV